MCNCYQILSKSTNGNVSISECENCIRISYGNVVIMQTYETFLGFFEGIEDCYVNNYDYECDETRDIVFGTRLPNMFLQFSAKEINELYHMLQSAVIKYEINI